MISAKQWNSLVVWLRSKSPEAPVLISGQGQADVIERLIKLSVCDQSDLEACGKCTGCRSSTPTDVIRVSVEEKTIGIKELRQVWDSLKLTSLAERRLVIIPQAERLSLPAANALLKSLEESAAATRFVLASNVPGSLLPTILSRVQQIRLGVAEPETPGKRSVILDDPILGRMAQAQTYTDQDIDELGWALMAGVRAGEVNASTRRALLRLRDYYKVRSMRGNVKLAREILLASLPQEKQE